MLPIEILRIAPEDALEIGFQVCPTNSPLAVRSLTLKPGTLGREKGLNMASLQRG